MGRVAINPDNKTGEGSSGFPAIKLTEKGQKTRFTILEEPWREYVHYIKCPQFKEDGKPKKVKKTRKNGDEYEDFELELVGTEICLGDEGTLAESGLDEKNCPACEASVATGGDIPGPVQRFSVNVAEYVTDRANNIKKPFSASIKVWKFTGRMYDEIEGIQEEIGPLQQHDITLECEDPFWNRNKIAFKMEPGYKSAPSGYMKELITTPGNKATDAQLRDACGREVSRARMQDDVDYARRQWRRLNTEAGSVPEEFKSTAADLDGGIDELLGEASDQPGPLAGEAEDPFAPAAETESSATAAEPEAEDPFAAYASAESPAASAGETSGSAPASEGGDFDFDGLLDGI